MSLGIGTRSGHGVYTGGRQSDPESANTPIITAGFAWLQSRNSGGHGAPKARTVRPKCCCHLSALVQVDWGTAMGMG